MGGALSGWCQCGEEIPQQGKPGSLAFFGMELGGVEVATGDGRRKSHAVDAPGAGQCRLREFGKVRMNKIKPWLRWRRPKKRAMRFLDLIPAHVGDFPGGGGKAADDAWQHSQSARSRRFLAGLEEKLVTQADS